MHHGRAIWKNLKTACGLSSTRNNAILIKRKGYGAAQDSGLNVSGIEVIKAKFSILGSGSDEL